VELLILVVLVNQQFLLKVCMLLPTYFFIYQNNLKELAMKRKDLRQLALMGLAGGALLLTPSKTQAALDVKTPSTTQTKEEVKGAQIDYSAADREYHKMSEKELLDVLDANGKKMYSELSPEGKKLAIDVASSKCSTYNTCKGLNACATEKNKCAGQGACKGQSKCAFIDKNMAVKVVYEKMKNKRAELNQANH
jgi:hypothetical protein